MPFSCATELNGTKCTTKFYSAQAWLFSVSEAAKDALVDAKWVANESTYPRSEWIRMGSCRRDQETVRASELTPWQLGPAVMAMLPKKPGEKYYRESEDDQGRARVTWDQTEVGRDPGGGLVRGIGFLA